MNTASSRKQELQDKITDLEVSLAALKSELDKEEEKEQHAAIDNLEDYLSQIDNKYENLRSFWHIVADEFRGLFNDRENKP
ncbi:MAG TPA: hypothetical protein DD979_07765 [Gammaproteobacteria bacterium]|jgi:predicted  nucleic acid-binding Zn-ribbon protein|nr:hypothetical protein [Gammaproteobacteria bacterium]